MNEITLSIYNLFAGIVMTAVGGSLIGYFWGYQWARKKWKRKYDKALKDYIITSEAYTKLWLRYLDLRGAARSVLKWLPRKEQQAPPQHAIDTFIEETQEGEEK